MLSSQDGILTKATHAKQQQEIGVIKDEIAMWKARNELANYTTDEDGESVTDFITRLKNNNIISDENLDGNVITIGNYKVDLDKENTLKQKGVKLEKPNIVASSNATGSSPAEWKAVEGAAYYEAIVINNLVKDRDGALEAAFSTGTFHWDDTLSETYGNTGNSAKMQLLKWDATEISYSDVSSIGDPTICVRAIPKNTNDYASEWSEWYYMYLCLSGNTQIIVYDEEEKKMKKKKLKDIKVGEKVITFNPETKEWEINEVIDCDFNEVKTMLEYDIWTFSDFTEITTVNRHRFYNVEHEKMMYMDEWQIGDRIYKVDGTMPKLVKHEHIMGPIRHYTLVTKNENYIANDCITGTRNMKPVRLNELKPLDII